MPTTCPPRDDLLRYLHGKDSAADRETFESHLVGCLSCQSLLEILWEEPDSLMQRIAAATEVRVIAGGPGLHSGFPEMAIDERSPQDNSAMVRSGIEQPPAMIRDYRILECIGSGGMGSVYRALHVKLDKQRALKILKPDRLGSREAISRFEQEMRVLARLEHHHIVTAFDAGEQDGLPYFVMEFVSGVNLQQLVRRVGPLPMQDACHIACLAASALQYAHTEQVIHRDVKPSNLMLTPSGNVKLVDLGLAQALQIDGDGVLSLADQVLGTLAYMSPEQLSGSQRVTPQSDIFSLGVTLYELLTGQCPSGRLGLPPRAADIQLHRPDVDMSLIALVADMLAMDPSRRPVSMSDVEARLRAIAPPANLSDLVAEYYRWRSKDIADPERGFARAETEASAALSTDRQSTPKPPGSLSSLDATRKLSAWKDASLVQKGQTMALLGCVATIAWMAITLWPSNPKSPKLLRGSDTQFSPDASELISHVQVSGENDFASQLLERGEVRIENTRTGEVYELINGNLELPPGEYMLRYHTPIGIQADGTAIEITSASTQTLRIEALLTEVFQYPVIPRVGAHATYYGQIRHAGWSDGRDSMAYTLYLEVLSEEDKPDLPLSKWLQVRITDDNHRYTETAYIKVDVKRWENAKKLEILEGYIEVDSPEIERFLAGQERASNSNGLVVLFDRQHDRLGELKGIPLPKRRRSAQDAIALFFAVENEMPIAAEQIRTARQMLSAQKIRNEWLGPVKSPKGSPDCYIASSRTKEQDDSAPGYRLACRKSDDSYPFGIVEIQVNIPILEATCTMKQAGTEKPNAQLSKSKLERIELKLRQLKLDADVFNAGIVKPPLPKPSPRLPHDLPDKKWFEEEFRWTYESKPSQPPVPAPIPVPPPSVPCSSRN